MTQSYEIKFSIFKLITFFYSGCSHVVLSKFLFLSALDLPTVALTTWFRTLHSQTKLK